MLKILSRNIIINLDYAKYIDIMLLHQITSRGLVALGHSDRLSDVHVGTSDIAAIFLYFSKTIYTQQYSINNPGNSASLLTCWKTVVRT